MVASQQSNQEQIVNTYDLLGRKLTRKHMDGGTQAYIVQQQNRIAC